VISFAWHAFVIESKKIGDSVFVDAANSARTSFPCVCVYFYW